MAMSKNKNKSKSVFERARIFLLVFMTAYYVNLNKFSTFEKIMILSENNYHKEKKEIHFVFSRAGLTQNRIFYLLKKFKIFRSHKHFPFLTLCFSLISFPLNINHDKKSKNPSLKRMHSIVCDASTMMIS